VGVNVGGILGVGVNDSCGKHMGSKIWRFSLGVDNMLTYQTFLTMPG
jgi:hypothetical protein